MWKNNRVISKPSSKTTSPNARNDIHSVSINTSTNIYEITIDQIIDHSSVSKINQSNQN